MIILDRGDRDLFVFCGFSLELVGVLRLNIFLFWFLFFGMDGGEAFFYFMEGNWFKEFYDLVKVDCL